MTKALTDRATWREIQAQPDIWRCWGDAPVKGTRSVPSTDSAADTFHVSAGAKPLVVGFGHSDNSAEANATPSRVVADVTFYRVAT